MSIFRSPAGRSISFYKVGIRVIVEEGGQVGVQNVDLI